MGGLDSEGKGCAFTYDDVGSYERVGYSSQGSGATLVTPFLDNQLKSPSPLLLPAKDAVTPLSESEAIDLVITCFASAAEKDIYTDGSENNGKTASEGKKSRGPKRNAGSIYNNDFLSGKRSKP